MKLIAFGGDARMDGAVMAAQRAGWETLHVHRADDMPEEMGAADAALLPWPHSFREGRLVGGEMSREETLALLPPCRMIVHGSGVSDEELPQAGAWLNPAGDEAFLMANAQLTAEGAICRAMERPGRALLGATVMVTGFGRIAQALTQRLAALGAFVIVCARSEAQMQRAHAIGAHPMHLSRIVSAAAQAEVIFNTVPARILSEAALLAMGRETLVVELASAPYGVDLELASRLGVTVALESGLPGRYAPLDAGAAIFDALQRAVNLNGNGGKGGKGDG